MKKHQNIDEEVSIIRGMDDARAFDYIIEQFPPNSESNVYLALSLMRQRPWRKEYHASLAKKYIQHIHGVGFQAAISAFLTFMKAKSLSRIIWNATDANPKDRHFAKYYFIGEISIKYGRDHPSLTRWLD